MPEPSRTASMPEDLDVRAILVGGLAIAGTLAIALLGSYAVLRLGQGDGPAPRTAARLHAPPPIAAPVRLQTDPGADIRALTRQKQALLTTYGWIDREHGIAHIPIERAMSLLARPERAP